MADQKVGGKFPVGEKFSRRNGVPFVCSGSRRGIKSRKVAAASQPSHTDRITDSTPECILPP